MLDHKSVERRADVAQELLSLTSEQLPAQWITAACVTLSVIVSRWYFRSKALFSWDSANFALALDRIDIGAHRPHPPGYLGYVFAARALNVLFHDANTALVVWNILATALAALILARFAWESATPECRTMTAIAAAAVVVTSPLVWFYGEVAEIYASEFLFASLIAYTAWRATRHNDGAMYACAALLVVAAVFKIFTAILMLPTVTYASTRVSRACQRRLIALAVGALAVVGSALLLFHRDLILLVWHIFLSSRWVFRGDRVMPMRMLNRNIRDTLTSAVVALGFVNVAALIMWFLKDRRQLLVHGRVLLLWLLPGLLMCLLIHIAKPGYLLPVVPVGLLVIAGVYGRSKPKVAATLIAAQAAVNVMYFILTPPLSASLTGGSTPYREKPMWQRALSDMEALTFPTAKRIEQSDRLVGTLLNWVSQTCPSRNPIIVVGAEPVDWRRVMWYLPEATAVHAIGSRVDFIGRHTDVAPLPEGGLELHTTCPVIWVAPDRGPGGVARPDATVRPVPLLGWMTAPGTVRVTGTSIRQIGNTVTRAPLNAGAPRERAE
jgi:hypothetical protein